MIKHTLYSPTEMSGLYVVYKGSAAAEENSIKGASHLLEHLICRQLKSLIREMTQYAINFGATTSDDFVCFCILGLEEYVQQYECRFYDELTKHMIFSQDDFDAEKNIVLREIHTKHIHPALQSIYQVLDHCMNYSGPAGTVSSVQSLTLEQIQNLYGRQYSEPYMTIRIGNKFSNQCTEIGEKHYLPPVVSLTKMNWHFPLMPPAKENVFMAISPVIPNSELPFSQIINYLLCGTIESPIYKTLRDELQLCYTVEMNYFLLGDYHINYMYVVGHNNCSTAMKENVYQIINHVDFLSEEKIAYAKNHFSILSRMHDANRYADVRHLLYNTIYSEGQLNIVNTSTILQHYDMYYKNKYISL